MTLSSLSQYQLDSLNALVSTPDSHPVSAESLLKLCITLYLRAPKREVYNDHFEGAHALFDCWYLDVESKFDVIHTRHYPAFTFPDVCICGSCFSPTGSVLRKACTSCEGNLNKSLLGPYEIQRLARYCSVNESYFESLVAKVIYYSLRLQP